MYDYFKKEKLEIFRNPPKILIIWSFSSSNYDNFFDFFPKCTLDHAAWVFCFQQTDIATKDHRDSPQFKYSKIWTALVYL
jgi:hypothetical protein